MSPNEVETLVIVAMGGLVVIVAILWLSRRSTSSALPTTTRSASARPQLLPTSEQRLARLERQVARLMSELGIEDDGAMPADDLQARIRPLIQADRKIEAIKVVREQTGMGLKDAKDYVEDLATQMRHGG